MKQLTTVLFCLVLASCGGKAAAGKVTRIHTGTDIKGQTLTLTATAGEHYTLPKKLGMMKINITPQIAVWIEDTKGNFIDTLYVTQAFGKQKWIFVKYDADVTLRDTCLPRWMNQRLKAGLKPPTKNQPLADTVTGATPKGSFVLTCRVPQELEEAVIFAEFNKSFDGNDAFHGAETNFTEGMVNGQPSVIYSGTVKMGQKGPVTMQLIGYGGEKGSDGAIYTGLEKLTTAKQQVSQITLDLL